MLVLSRKANEAIVLPELGIRILVVEIRAGSVKIGIEADRRHTILREELSTQPAATPEDADGVSHVDITAESASSVS